jgi:ELWxxDGT repeat protein
MVDGRLLSFVSLGTSTTDDHELWSMNPDGTRAKSIWKTPGPMDGNDALFGFRGTTPHGAVFYFSDGHGTRQIYRTDGTRRGTRVMSDHSAGPGKGIPYGFAQLGDQVFYSVSSTDAPVTSLWKTNGTPEGTMKIVAADGTAPKPVLSELMPSFQGSLYFLAYGTGGRLQLWRTDGTPAGTMLLKDEWSGGTPTELTAAGGKLLFKVKFYQSILWQSDGTAAGTVPVPGAPAFIVGDDESRFTDLGNGTVLFQAVSTRGEPPWWWRHDATGTHPLPIPDVEMYFMSSDWDEYHAVLGNKVIYTTIGYDGYNLWVTDGTEAGTHQVNAAGSAFQSAPRSLLTVGNHVYFTGWDAAHGQELWRTDGTEAGTVLVADIEPGPAGSSPYGLKVMNGKLYFSAYRSDVGTELFVIDLPQH